MASNALLLHFAAALSTFANHEGTIREQMKAVRTREENLDELKRRRKSIFTDAEAAERKLSKMNPENKNLQQQTDILTVSARGSSHVLQKCPVPHVSATCSHSLVAACLARRGWAAAWE